MSSFWKDVKQTFSSPKQELDETSKAILDIENKMRAIVQASQNEQNSIKEKINAEYRRIGETSYALHKDGKYEIEKIVSMFATVKTLYETLEGKQAKLNEILSRYDEELKILRPAPPMGHKTCLNCQAIYIPGEMLFCRSCGNKLPEKAPESQESESPPVQQSACPHCNATLVPGAVFCASCGQKL